MTDSKSQKEIKKKDSKAVAAKFTDADFLSSYVPLQVLATPDANPYARSGDGLVLIRGLKRAVSSVSNFDVVYDSKSTRTRIILTCLPEIEAVAAISPCIIVSLASDSEAPSDDYMSTANFAKFCESLSAKESAMIVRLTAVLHDHSVIDPLTRKIISFSKIEKLFSDIVDTLAQLHQENSGETVTIVFHCAAGVERSAVFVAAFLMKWLGMLLTGRQFESDETKSDQSIQEQKLTVKGAMEQVALARESAKTLHSYSGRELLTEQIRGFSGAIFLRILSKELHVAFLRRQILLAPQVTHERLLLPQLFLSNKSINVPLLASNLQPLFSSDYFMLATRDREQLVNDFWYLWKYFSVYKVDITAWNLQHLNAKEQANFVILQEQIAKREMLLAHKIATAKHIIQEYGKRHSRVLANLGQVIQNLEETKGHKEWNYFAELLEVELRNETLLYAIPAISKRLSEFQVRHEESSIKRLQQVVINLLTANDANYMVGGLFVELYLLYQKSHSHVQILFNYLENFLPKMNGAQLAEFFFSTFIQNNVKISAINSFYIKLVATEKLNYLTRVVENMQRDKLSFQDLVVPLPRMLVEIIADEKLSSVDVVKCLCLTINMPKYFVDVFNALNKKGDLQTLTASQILYLLMEFKNTSQQVVEMVLQTLLPKKVVDAWRSDLNTVQNAAFEQLCSENASMRRYFVGEEEKKAPQMT